LLRGPVCGYPLYLTFTMPRRSRPWCSPSRSRRNTVISLTWSCLLLTTCTEISTAFFQIHAITGKEVLSAPTAPARPLGPRSRPAWSRDGPNYVPSTVADDRRWRRRRSGDAALRMGTQQETKP
ncbi:unnamed protein product, partial [Scytosiphon promiscuus]